MRAQTKVCGELLERQLATVPCSEVIEQVSTLHVEVRSRGGAGEKRMQKSAR